MLLSHTFKAWLFTGMTSNIHVNSIIDQLYKIDKLDNGNFLWNLQQMYAQQKLNFS